MAFPLVVGVDGSESSLRAVDWAVDEAARHGLPLHLVHASLWERYERARPALSTARPAPEVLAQHILASSAERAALRDPEVKVAGEVLSEDAASALLRAGAEAFGVVTGARGRGELTGLLLGSVSLTVAARASCPVVVVRGAERNVQATMGRVVVGVGGSSGDTAALGFAVREAEVRGCDLSVVRAWRSPVAERGKPSSPASGREDRPDPDDAARMPHQQASADLDEALRGALREHPGVTIHRHLLEGPAHRVLVEASDAADLIVVGAQRRSGHFGLQLGRVAHALLHHANCPVAVVPQAG
ncbi:universal stress protein [Streptomyces sp. NPDC005574]|uniref:universal stress protein n=1 Tax=Streptomyces sp. NPDC005574 TaxID=3156891 RepID=UPI0033A6BF0E